MRTTTCVDGEYTGRAELKQHTPVRQKRQNLRLQLKALQRAGHRHSDKAGELRAQASILDELIAVSP